MEERGLSLSAELFYQKLNIFGEIIHKTNFRKCLQGIRMNIFANVIFVMRSNMNTEVTKYL